MQKLQRFFWICSGADLALLKRSPSEASRYTGIGATVFFTGIFAFLAAAYALFTIFDNIWAAIPFGLLWGAMIFNLDRYIVSTMRKKNGFWSEFKMAIPRLILAVLISIVIAKPLELKIFEKEIESELVNMEQNIYKQQEDNIKSRFSTEISVLSNEIVGLKRETTTKESERDALRTMAQQEADGTGGSGVKNLGPIYKLKKADLEKTEAELKDLVVRNDRLIDAKQAEIMVLKANIGGEITSLVRKGFDGMAARLDALSHLTANSEAIKWANWFMLLLFIAIETEPILVKLIAQRGPYDDLIQTHEHTFEMYRVEKMAKLEHDTEKRLEGYGIQTANEIAMPNPS